MSVQGTGLRCLLFSPDEGTSASLRQVLDDLGVEGESCPQAVTAVQQVTQQPYQIVIVDWDQQPEAGLVLAAARERKASERPLILGIVTHDHNVPKALQAGANSILRKPIALNQAKDTLKTARDLLRARQESAAGAGSAAKSQPSASTVPSSLEGNERSLRGAEFLPSSVSAPGGQFDTESDLQKSMAQSATNEVDPLKELEPMAAAVTRAKVSPAPPPVVPDQPRSDQSRSDQSRSDEPRGLQWYLNQRAAAAPKMAPQSEPAAQPSAPAEATPELMGFDQMVESPQQRSSDVELHQAPPESSPREQKHEAELFAHMAGESTEKESQEKPRRSFRLSKAIVGAVALAACAVVAAPQAPWHARMQAIWKREQLALHAYLNPQVVTTVQAPESHENFARAGDEYKLPVAENIPDATTDPSQIRVVPVIDPTAKKTPGSDASPDQPAESTGDASNPSQAAVQPTSGTETSAQPGPAGSVSAGAQSDSAPAGTQPSGAQSGNENSAVTNSSASAISPAVASPAVTQAHPEVAPAAVSDSSSVRPGSNQTGSNQTSSGQTTSGQATPPQPAPTPVPQARPQSQSVSTTAASTLPTPRVPSSLKSQIATMVPEASGNKPPEAALPSIEPVSISENAARALLTDQPAVAYPTSAKGQQGTVILQVLIGRDGMVEDAKFVQGSLAFARSAIDGARQWKFKPYLLNGRPVSVETSLTMIFKPAP